MRRVFQQTLLILVLSLLGGVAAASASTETVEEASQTEAPAPAPSVEAPPAVEQGATIEAPATKPRESGGVDAEAPEPKPAPKPKRDADGGTGAATAPTSPLSVPYLPAASCSPAAVPAILVPIYRRAANAYGLGPQGPAVLAAINRVETAFGSNLNVSSAGAIGWMQFMPASWETYGVDANGDGVRDPYNPEDAIFAAANYLSAAGFPTDVYGAIFAYNHADWYVADVLSTAACYGSLNGGFTSALTLTPRLQVLRCKAAEGWRKRLPTEYLNAFESAAARYELGRRGVWALAAVARIESDFGRAMSKRQLRRSGPLGLDGAEWRRYRVDGDGNGRIQRFDPDDSAATLAREIWSRGDLRAGLFAHNQAAWYVQAVLADAARMEGRCKASEVAWALSLPQAVIAPIEWENLTLSNELEESDLATGAIDPRVVGLLGAITQEHTVVVTALRSDHSRLTVEGNVSNHFFGRAMDISAVDGVSCADTAPDAPCAELGRTLAALPTPAMPTELIYCFDLDGPGPAFARADHCDHLHVGYDG
jgi:hypothetical protein